MKSRLIYFILFALLVTVLVLDLPQLFMAHDVNAAYAKNDKRKKPKPGHEPGHEPISVPEPSTLALSGTGIAGVGIYLFLKNKNKKK